MSPQEQTSHLEKQTKHNVSGVVITTAVVTAVLTTGLSTFLINYFDLNKNKINTYVVESLYKSLETVATTNNNENVTIGDESIIPKKEYKAEDLFVSIPTGNPSVNIKEGLVYHYINKLIQKAIADYKIIDEQNDYNPDGKGGMY